ncbi:MAG: hypothetical protein AELANPGJ_02870 [Anaerolineae bacterium]|nr:hypothetical protein [Anaerolineae bacterium]GIK28175.1 MAG: hypothetical protein BroJett007_13130 [Chloroflexota bacterium]
MPIIDDILNGLQIQIDTLWYNLLFSLAGLGWSLQRAFLMMGYTIELMNQWLVENAFTPLIAQTNASLQVAVSMAFIVALLVLGVTYLLAAFARMRIVEPKNAIAWYLAGALFFALGPSLYQGMSDFRRTLSSAFYASSLSGLSGATGSAFDSLDSVDSSDMGILTLCDNFGSYMPDWNYTLDGLDVALAYLRADGIDLMGYPSTPRDPLCQPHTPDPGTGLWTAGSVPWEWRRPGSFFANDRDPVFFSIMTPLERADSIAMASAAQGRLLTAWPLILFGLTEQLVYLLLTIAQGLTFISFGVAILFAFFKKTEVIARSIIDLWIELVVQTIVIALIQALVVTFFLAGTASGNGIVVLGVGLICLIFMVIVLFSGVKAVWNSFNRLFNAFGQATGGAVISPGAAAITSAAGAVGVAGLAAGGAISIGSSAMAGATALRSGATPAQAAGLTFGGVSPLADAARHLIRLPGLRGTALGDAAEQFTEGAVTRRVARDVPLIGGALGPTLGAKLLTDYDPEAAEYDDKGRLIRRPMLVPAVGAGLEALTYPRGKNPRKHAARDDESEWIEDEDGELFPGFMPLRRRRTGMFTPMASTPTGAAADEEIARERETYADDMRGEEMEQHISEVARSTTGTSGSRFESDRIEGAAGRLERSAEALERAAGTMAGSLRLSGTTDVTSVMGDVMRLLGGQGATGVDHLTVAGLMARAVGVTPLNDGKPPVRDNLARFGMFVDSAARLGLTPEQTERVGREVKETPDRRMTADTRAELIQGALAAGRSRDEAERDMNRLEIAARLLPNEITAYGAMPVPSVTVAPEVKVEPNITIAASDESSDYDDAMRSSASMSGSDTLLGGKE